MRPYLWGVVVVAAIVAVYSGVTSDYYAPPSVPVAQQAVPRPTIGQPTGPLLSPLGEPVRIPEKELTQRSSVPDCDSDATPPRRGAELFPGERGDAGRLVFSNNGNADAVVTMKRVLNSRSVRRIYAPAGERGLILDVPAGVYRVLFAFGSGYSSVHGRFCTDMGAEEYVNTFSYSVDSTTTVTITLRPTVNGNAKTSRIPSELVFRDSL